MLVNAGNDQTLMLPVNEAYLAGSYTYTGNSSTKINWDKLSGPASLAIENKNALLTKLSNLEEGVYQFELTVTDAGGIYDKDTVAIKVMKPAVPTVTIDSGQITYTDLQWIFPWYNSIEIKNFNSLLPPGRPFKIYIQRDNAPQWKEIMLLSSSSDPAIKYEYFIETRPDGAGMYNFGSLYIFYYGTDVDDTPSVKIVL